MSTSTSNDIKWFLGGLKSHHLVLGQIIHQQFTLRYHRTVFGLLWTLINPLITMTVIAAVFATIMRMPLKSFAVFLYSGLVPWTMFSVTITACAAALVSNEALIKKVFIPKQVFIASTAITTFIDSLISMAALFLVALALGAKITPALLTLPISFILLFIFSLGLSLIISVATVYFRDIPNLTSIGLQLMYYLTPILYPLSFVPTEYIKIFKANPFYYFLQLFREPIYNGSTPELATYYKTSAMAIAALLLGIRVFRKFDNRIIFRL